MTEHPDLWASKRARMAWRAEEDLLGIKRTHFCTYSASDRYAKCIECGRENPKPLPPLPADDAFKYRAP